MYNILIVDDEYLARNKIKRILEYKKYDFRIVGDVANGKEAVSFIENHSVDVVFSDVEMPEMDGIELAKHIKKHYPDIKVIIMSNYDNFDYVKQAFKVEVIDYCLKNALSEEVMEEILLQLREDLKKRKTEALGQAAQSDSEYAMKVESAVKGENLSFWPVNSIIIAFQIVDIKVNKQIYSAAEISILYKNIMDLIIQVVKEREGICVFEKDDIIVLYMPFETHVSETEIMNLLNRYIHQIGSSVYKFFNFNILCGISRPTSKKYTLNACFHEAVGMLHTTPVKSKREKKPVWNMTVMPISISQEKTLLGALTNWN